MTDTQYYLHIAADTNKMPMDNGIYRPIPTNTYCPKNGGEHFKHITKRLAAG
jgi:hypothetical protein